MFTPRFMKVLPSGVDSFEKMIHGNGKQYYYVDKTLLIRDIINSAADVSLIPRPRRFGKSLNLDMIRQFVSMDADPTLFDGLKISEDRDFCELHQNKYPVLYFNMKDLKAQSFAQMCRDFSKSISSTTRQYKYLKTSPYLDEDEQYICKMYSNFREWRADDGKSLPLSDLKEGLENLSHFLEMHHHKKVVVLIDEYDVPLNAAWVYNQADPGYYDNMVDLVQGVFSRLLNSNTSVAFAVVTGCMRITKESIFTGMNNVRVWNLATQFSQDYFGFTESEVQALLDYYGILELYDTIKEWYDGFCFGGESLYCPWDVIEYVYNCTNKPRNREPVQFWANGSGNDILTKLLERSTYKIQQNYLKLMKGESIQVGFMEEMTFRDLINVNNIWSLMVATGYLKVVSRNKTEAVVKVPNREVQDLLGLHLNSWIKGFSSDNEDIIRALCLAFPKGDVKAVIDQYSKILKSIIHLHDQRQNAERRETLYIKALF